MFLSIDIGNTQTTFGLFADADLYREDATPQLQWRMVTDSNNTADELHSQLFTFFQMNDMTLSGVSDVAIASVVPNLTSSWKSALSSVFAVEPLIVDPLAHCGIGIDMPDPRQVGADRIANAAAAIKTYGAPVIVVDFGTATNIDVVDAAGNFRGGVIMPGLMLSAKALFARAAKLSSVPLVMPEHALGNSTETALQSGVIIGAAAAAEGLVTRIIEELDGPRPAVVATGGLSHTVGQATTIFDTIDADLTLRGIHQIWISQSAMH